MSRFAVIKEEVVINVIIAEQDYISEITNRDKDLLFKEQEDVNINDLYISDKDTFVREQPFEDWVLDELKTDWKAPKEKPKTEGKEYAWDRNTKDWVDYTRSTTSEIELKEGDLIKKLDIENLK